MTSGRPWTTTAGVASLLCVLGVLAAVPWWASQGQTNDLVRFFYLLAMAEMWNLLAGYGGLVSVGQQAFIGLGGYAFYLLADRGGIEPFGAVALAGLSAAGISLVTAAVAFHALMDPPGLPPEKIKAKVVAFHGWDDPMVPPEMVVALGNELTAGGADWQIHAYGHVGHGFTNPNAHMIGIDGVFYHQLAAERSWTSFINLLEELFAGHG